MSPTEVQELLALAEGERRLIPHLPGRLLLPNGEVALTRSSDGEQYYQQVKREGAWSCSCPAGAHEQMCWHVRGLKRYLGVA